jgi:hypothetical protein
MPTRVVFLDKDLALTVAEELDDVRKLIELQARSGRLVNLQSASGEPVWINPEAVAYLEGSSE